MIETFEGHQRFCGDYAPHAPHLSGKPYHTVRYGTLDTFCRGVPAEPPAYEEVSYRAGDAGTPARLTVRHLTPA